jgi:NADPH:quinone reductase-like Zn-dependent oxidoreductase
MPQGSGYTYKPKTVKAVIFEQSGLPKDVLQVKEMPLPEPGKGEVRIRVKTANINPSDIMFIRGMYGIQAKLPSSAGFEAAGIIDKAGEGVEWQPGAQVIFSAAGVWQEYVVIPTRGIFPKPAELSFEEACQAFVNPFTAYGMLDVAQLQSGEFLLLTAGASAFSKLVIQMAAKRGIRVLATVRQDEQIEGLMALGAEKVINTEKEKLQKAVMEHTGGKGVKAVFDAVGGTLAARALAALATGGTMYSYGLLSLEQMPVNNGLLIFKNLTIKGFWLTTWLESLDKAKRQQVFTEVFGGLGKHELKLDIEAVYSLDEILKAVAHFEKPGRKGKIILNI